MAVVTQTLMDPPLRRRQTQSELEKLKILHCISTINSKCELCLLNYSYIPVLSFSLALALSLSVRLSLY